MVAFLMQTVESINDIPWFVIYTVVLMTAAILLLLSLVLLLAHKLNKVLMKLESISENAGKFVQMGMTFFKSSSKR
jgi:hypothetical protein